MSTNASKVVGSTINWGGVKIGEVTDVGRQTMTFNEKKLVTTDGTNYIDQDEDRSQLALSVIYDGLVGGVWAMLKTDYDARTEKTLEIIKPDGSKDSRTARIASLDTPGGAADGGHYEYSVAFRAVDTTLTFTGV